MLKIIDTEESPGALLDLSIVNWSLKKFWYIEWNQVVIIFHVKGTKYKLYEDVNSLLIDKVVFFFLYWP